MSRQHPRQTPWRDLAELHSVKSDFYSTSTSDRRNHALTKVRAWTIRGRLPHSIEATAMLTESILADTPSIALIVRRLSYSTAICRFVNGLLDPAQQSQFAMPMHALAAKLGLPASFVELRHAATHEALPSLEVLRPLAERALDWLWGNYWATVGVEGEELEPVVAPVEEVRLSRPRLLLKAWRRLRKENPLKEVKPGDRESLGVIKECVKLCKDEEGLEAFVEACLEEKALVPKGGKTKRMEGAVMLWSPLLEAVAGKVDVLVGSLIEAILEVFKAVAGSVIPKVGKEQKEAAVDAGFLKAVFKWVKVLTANDGKARFGKIDADEIAKTCILSPNEWSLSLLEYLVKEYPLIKPRYQSLLDLAGSQTITTPSVCPTRKRKASEAEEQPVRSRRRIEDVEEEVQAFEERLAKMQQQRQEWDGVQTQPVAEDETMDGIAEESRRVGRWRRWDGPWITRPMGIIEA